MVLHTTGQYSPSMGEVGVSDPIEGKSPFIDHSFVHKISRIAGAKTDFRRGNTVSFVKGCSGEGFKPFLPGVLFKVVPDEEERKVKTSFRSYSFQSVHLSSKVSDVYGKSVNSGHGVRRFRNISRSSRRLLSRAHSPIVKKVPEVRLQQQSLPICMSPIRPIVQPIRFYTGNESRNEDTAAVDRGLFLGVSGRLSPKTPQSLDFTNSRDRLSQTPPPTGLCSQPRKVGFGSYSGFHASRFDFSNNYRHSVYFRRPHREPGLFFSC
ncbi:hypothetical protein SNE40_020806 [Patella caerulea]|uniref:Uncharacterized protein n=1 Tax=Patella caerulea TaxID=87958 RepID=A0AAN8PBS4_PATCE